MAAPENLGDGLLDLASLVAASVPLEQTMLRVAEYALELTQNGAGAALSTFDAGQPRVTVATSEAVRAADDAQYATREGPGLSAVAQQKVFVSGSLGSEPAWPRFAGRVRRLGLHSALASPLILHGDTVGVLTVYAVRKAAFTERDIVAAQRYSGPVAVVIRNAEILARSRAEIEQLRTALQVRPAIDQAIGIIRSRTGKSEAEAFERLRVISSRMHMRVADVATRIVEDAARRAQERRHRS